MKGLINKRCIVTGGSNGIGKAICNRLLEEGAHVIILDLQTPDYIQDKNACFYQCDLSSEDNITNTIKQINKDYDSIDVLVNNAAIFIMKGIEATEDEWQKKPTS